MLIILNVFSPCRSQCLKQRPWSQLSVPGKVGATTTPGDLAFFFSFPFFTIEVMGLNYSFVTFKVLCTNSFPFCWEITTLHVMGIHSSKALEHPKKTHPIFHFRHFRRQGEDIAMRQTVDISLLCQIFLTAALL